MELGGTPLTLIPYIGLNKCSIKLRSDNILEIVFVFIEKLIKILLFRYSFMLSTVYLPIGLLYRFSSVSFISIDARKSLCWRKATH